MNGQAVLNATETNKKEGEKEKKKHVDSTRAGLDCGDTNPTWNRFFFLSYATNRVGDVIASECMRATCIILNILALLRNRRNTPP